MGSSRFLLVVPVAGALLVLGCARDGASSPDGRAAHTPRTVTPEVTPLVVSKLRLNDRRIDLARDAALKGDAATVRRLLEQTVLAGHGTMEEARLVRESCKAMADRACVNEVRLRYPDV
jgi:hypothetical protein